MPETGVEQSPDFPGVPADDLLAPPPSACPQSGAVVVRLPRQRTVERDAQIARDLMERWVEALSDRPSVRLAALDAEHADGPARWINQYPTSAHVSQAAPGQPVAMSLTRAGTWHRPVFVCLPWDLDAKRLGAEAVAAAEALFTAHLESCGIAVVAATSGPDGGRHLWTRCPQGLPKVLVDRIAAASVALSATFDTAVWSCGQSAVRPPGSPHRSGGYARLDAESPADIAAAIALLRAGSPRAAFELLAERLEAAAGELRAAQGDCGQAAPEPPSAGAAGRLDPSRPIVLDAATGLATGLRRGKRLHMSFATEAALARALDPGEDFSAHCARVLVGLVLHGWQLSDIRAVAEGAAGLEHLRSERTRPGAATRTALSPAEREARLRRQVDRAVRYAAALPAPRAGADEEQAGEQRRLVEVAVALALELMDGEDPGRWGGAYRPSGPADRATVTHALLTMLRVGAYEVELPCRAVARQIGRHHDTAARSLWRLNQDALYLVRTAEAAGPHGARYSLPPALLEHARTLLATHDAATAAPECTPEINAPTVPDETTVHKHDRGEAARSNGVPTQGTPPPSGEGGRDDGAKGAPWAQGPVSSRGVEDGPPTQASPGEIAADVSSNPAHQVSARLQDELVFKVTTDQKQDQNRRLHDQLFVWDPVADRVRLQAELGIWAADLFAHRTGQRADLGRHCAWTLVALCQKTQRRADALSVEQLAEATGLTAGTVRRHLLALQLRDLVADAPRDGGWYPTGVDVAAVDQGSGAGTAARRAERHLIDAAQWAWWQAELEFLRLPRRAKRAAAHRGRRHPYGQGQIQRATPDTIAEHVSHLRYPRKIAGIRPRTGLSLAELVPDHAEAASIIARLLHGEPAASPGGPTPPAASDPFAEGDREAAPDFVRDALAAADAPAQDAHRVPADALGAVRVRPEAA